MTPPHRRAVQASSVRREPGVGQGMKTIVIETLDRIHTWFGLSYAQYLTIPRSVLQSMPDEWQDRFVTCLEELDTTIDWRPSEGRYWVELRDARGRIAADPFKDYQRGRRRVVHRDRGDG